MSIRPKFKKTVFDNGLTLLTERHTHFKSLSIGVWVRAGTRHERAHEAGGSHFLEHMLFKGTDNRTALDIARQVDQVGGEFNAFTSREDTCFHMLLLADHLNLGLEILSDVVLNSNFHPEEYERERKVILQEIAMVDESPEELVTDMQFDLVYGGHPLGKPILGTERSIKKMKRGDLMKFFRRFYRPDQLIVTVAGDVAHEQVRRKLKALTRDKWPGREPGGKRDFATPPAPRLKSGCWWMKRPTEQIHVVWGNQSMKYSSPDRYAMYLLSNYLGGGMSSILFQEIREKNGLAYTVYANHQPYTDSGHFSVYVGTSMAKLPLCLKLIDECMAKVKKELLTEKDLRMVKDNFNGSLLMNSDNVESRMIAIARNEMYLGEHLTLEEVCRRIEKVTAEEIRRVARKILKPETQSLLVLGPKPTPALLKKIGAKLLVR